MNTGIWINKLNPSAILKLGTWPADPGACPAAAGTPGLLCQEEPIAGALPGEGLEEALFRPLVATTGTAPPVPGNAVNPDTRAPWSPHFAESLGVPLPAPSHTGQSPSPHLHLPESSFPVRPFHFTVPASSSPAWFILHNLTASSPPPTGSISHRIVVCLFVCLPHCAACGILVPH